MGRSTHNTELEPPFEAYRGDEPFIFVSYAHRDCRLVYPELQRLRDLGCRIWYDEGIDPGNEWPEAVATALDECAYFVVFLSPAAVDSKNVRDEVHFALDHDKTMLAVHLVETVLPRGLALRISSIQMVMKWRMREERYRRALELALPAEGGAPVARAAATDVVAPPTAGEATALRRLVRQWCALLGRWPRTRLLVAAGLALVVGVAGIGWAVRGRHAAGAAQEAPTLPAAAVAGEPSQTPETPVHAPASEAELQRRSMATAKAAGLKWRVSSKDDMPQVLIPAGEFLMGSPDNEAGRDSDEGPQKRVYVSAFWMDLHEVTVAQYRRFCQASGRTMDTANTVDPHPVVDVTWDDAAAYAQWAGRQLPTEAQWEKAARGGLEGMAYPWGNDWDATMANNNGAGTQPVGSYEPNGYGLFDMAGNVWEWCRDWYDEGWYARMPARDPCNQTQATDRVLRGGSWYVDPRYVRAACRKGDYPYCRFDTNGFRCSEAP